MDAYEGATSTVGDAVSVPAKHFVGAIGRLPNVVTYDPFNVLTFFVRRHSSAGRTADL